MDNIELIAEAAPLKPREWVSAHADYLYAYTITRVNNEEQARDLVQETFLAALEGIHKFEGKSSERTWLTAILRNKIIDTYRKKTKGLKTLSINDTGAGETEFFWDQEGHWHQEHWPAPFGIDNTDPMLTKEFNHILQKCMHKLPSLWLSVFTMKHMDDQTTDVICAELKISASNFWVIIHRAKLNLRACLQKNWV
ncbi:sigma-70 family RNA polymerase sigma factor [Mucilaginibacter sp. 14171R-50]|uniref:sigma-70 family RNA polymerase sigma factor n=1 Tax=Mucilaginibacter sp. 14171R-50 TaxID=2703789 RepID=UPI00138B7CDA|nr:sigma-70 family RNA polymerase sigma factor [Mucilaginibacter sp. 14171R-50]QHS54911.1 sigma-70 family RNA polymerase sigma factor [Mucilaginibacter sp. 14171R-50]